MTTTKYPPPPYDINARTFEFACRIVKFHRNLPTNPRTLLRLGDQLLKAATSVGANLEEAKLPRAGGILWRKMRSVCANAARRFTGCDEAATELMLPGALDTLIGEADELVSILTAIVRRSRLTLRATQAARVMLVAGFASLTFLS